MRLRRFFKMLKNDKELQYAIRKEILMNGKEKLTPVVREVGLFEGWIPIVKINNEYYAIDVGSEYNYTEKECLGHIEGYKEQLNKLSENNVREVLYEEF
jgi:hypothetical protein